MVNKIASAPYSLEIRRKVEQKTKSYPKTNFLLICNSRNKNNQKLKDKRNTEVQILSIQILISSQYNFHLLTIYWIQRFLAFQFLQKCQANHRIRQIHRSQAELNITFHTNKKTDDNNKKKKKILQLVLIC